MENVPENYHLIKILICGVFAWAVGMLAGCTASLEDGIVVGGAEIQKVVNERKMIGAQAQRAGREK